MDIERGISPEARKIYRSLLTISREPLKAGKITRQSLKDFTIDSIGLNEERLATRLAGFQEALTRLH